MKNKQEFLSTINKYLKDQKEKLKYHEESIDSFNNAYRQTLTVCTFKKLCELKKDQDSIKLLQVFFVNFYHEKAEDFNFETFTSVALKKDLVDFQYKLAHFSVSQLNHEQRAVFMDLKSRSYEANQNNEDLLNLIKLLEFNYECFVSTKEKEQTQEANEKAIIKEQKYKSFIDSVEGIIKEYDFIITYCDTHINNLKLYKKKLEEANNLLKRNAIHIY